MARTCLIYGNSRTYKTTALGMAARYLYEKSGGKPVRGIFFDRGDAGAVLGNLIKAGIIEPFFCEVELVGEVEPPGGYLVTYAPVIMQRLHSGFWPNELKDGRMIVREKAKAFVHPGTGTNRLENYSGYLVEGLTSEADVLMEHLINDQRTLGEATVGKFEVKLPGEEKADKFGAPARSYYNWVQKRELALLRMLANLPVDRVIVTAHEAHGTDDDGKAIRGPGIAGKAATSSVLRDVGTTIHAEAYTSVVEHVDPVTKLKTALQETKVRMFFTNHPDLVFSNVHYLAGPRLPSEKIEKLVKRWPSKYFEPSVKFGDGGFDEYLRLEDELIGGVEEELEAWKRMVQAAKGAKEDQGK